MDKRERDWKMRDGKKKFSIRISNDLWGTGYAESTRSRIHVTRYVRDGEIFFEYFCRTLKPDERGRGESKSFFPIKFAPLPPSSKTARYFRSLARQ